MEDSGDLRSSSICEELQHTLQRAVFHFQDLSRSPVQKVLFSYIPRSSSTWDELGSRTIRMCLAVWSCQYWWLCGIYTYIKGWTVIQNTLHVSRLNWSVELHGAEFILRANEPSATLDIPRMQWNLEVYNCVHMCATPVSVLSQRCEDRLNSCSQSISVL